MAEKATVCKANITLSDMDRHYYGDLSLTIAQHPSETAERMMVRLLSFCYRAADNLTFTRGLSSVDEPDIWLKSDDGRILEWIEVGQPATYRLKKAQGVARQVLVFAYGRGIDIWWKNNTAAVQALSKVKVYYFDAAELQDLTKLAAKTMNLTISITEAIAYISSAEHNISVSLRDMS